jgi:hypothetical protein
LTIDRDVNEIIEFLRINGAIRVDYLKSKFGTGVIERLKNDNRFIIIKTENAEYLDLKESWEGVFEAIEGQMKEKEREEEMLKNPEVITLDYYSNLRKNNA